MQALRPVSRWNRIVCILLVEDDVLIRLLLSEELLDAGFEVREAVNGEQAAQMILHPPVPFSLLITDIHMPGPLSGKEVAMLMRERRPDLPIIFTTGRPDVVGPLGPRETLLSKPFTPSALLGLVRQLIPSPTTSP